MFANSSLRTISSWFFWRTQSMFAAYWVLCSSEFLFSSMFVGRFSYLANNFHITVSAVGSSFSPGSPEVRGKINFSNMFVNMLANTIFANVYAALYSRKINLLCPRMRSACMMWSSVPAFIRLLCADGVVYVAYVLCKCVALMNVVCSPARLWCPIFSNQKSLAIITRSGQDPQNEQILDPFWLFKKFSYSNPFLIPGSLIHKVHN